MASGSNNGGGTWLIILLAVFVVAFLSPALICGGCGLGFEVGEIIASPWGWGCSLLFWLALFGGAVLLKIIHGSDD